MRWFSATPLLIMLATSLPLSACSPEAGAIPAGTLAYIYTSAAQTADTQSALLSASESPPAISSPTQYSLWTSTVIPFPTDTPYLYVPYAATTSMCDNSAFVADVTYPDNTVVAPDTPFTKTWSLENTGTCTWDRSYRLFFISGNEMGGATTSINDSVAPGDSTEISVLMVSPGDDGTYTGYWRMMNSDGVEFGESVYVTIEVSASVTSTPTITHTPTITDTAFPTTASTATVLPTTASTATALPTTASTATALPTTASTATALPTTASTATSLPAITNTATNIPVPTSAPVPEGTATN